MNAVYSARAPFPRGPNAFSARCQAIRNSGVIALDLTASNPTEVGLFADESWLRLLSKSESARYRPEPFGLASARAAVAEAYAARGLHVEPSQVILSSSTSEAYSWVFALLCDPGDSILTPAPSYPLLHHLASLAHVRPRTYGIGYDGAYFIDLDSVRANLEPSTRAIVLISPNNPTGSFTRSDELEALEALSLPIISDEVFADFCLQPKPPDIPSALLAKHSLVFALGGLSKAYGWPQLKLAWIVVHGPVEQRREALARLELIADTFLSVNTPVQEALADLVAFGRDRQQRISQRLLANWRTVERLTADSPVTARPVQGGWSSVLCLPLTEPGDWATALIEREHVLVQPGWFYDFDDDRLIVLSLLTPEADFTEGVTRIVNASTGR
jgi:alanine-synthesizing transaminase